MTTQLATTSPAPVAAIPRSVKGYLTSDYFRKQVALCLPKHMTAERFVRIAISATTRIPKLLKCTPESVVKCCLSLSELGLEPDGRRAHLIPYGDQCTLIVDYKGLVELAMNSGTVSSIFAERVCANDDFNWDTGEVQHKINWREDRGKMYAVYVVIKFKDGGKHTEVMTKSDVDRIRGRSKAANNGPWVTDYDEMAKKTVFRRASKWVKLSPEVQEALEKADALPAADSNLVSEIAELPENVTELETRPESSDDGDLGPQPAPQQSRVAPEAGGEPSPVNPTSKAPAGRSDRVKPFEELASLVIDAGYTFDDFVKWVTTEYWDERTARENGVEDWQSFDDVTVQVCRTLLRAKTGLLEGLAKVTGKGQP